MIRKSHLVFIVLSALAIAGSVAWYFLSLPRRFSVVDEGVLYRSGQGDPHQIRNAIRRYRIRTIVCLRETDETRGDSWLAEERQIAESHHVHFVHMPTDSHQPLRESDVRAFLRLTQDPDRRPVLVHCAQGKHRAGGFVAAYRMIVNDWPFGPTIRELDSFGFGLGTHEPILESLRRMDASALRAQEKIVPRPNEAAPRRSDLLWSVGLWTLFGFAGQFFFFSRFMVQWISSEKKGRTHVPIAFWYLSLLGGVILTIYAIGQHEIVFTLGQGLGCFIYIRNLMIIRRNQLQPAEVFDNGR